MYEYWLNFCKENDFNEIKIGEKANLSMKEIKQVFLNEPIKTIELDEKTLNFIIGDKELIKFIKNNQIDLIDAYKKFPQALSINIRDLIDLLKKRFKTLTFEELLDICKKGNYDVDLINYNLGELKRKVCSITSLKKSILKYPKKVVQLDFEALTFLFDETKADFLVTYRNLILQIIENNPEYLFEFSNLRQAVLKHFDEILIKSKFNEKVFLEIIEKEGYKKEQLCKNFETIRSFLYKKEIEKINLLDPTVSKVNKTLEILINLNDEREIEELISKSKISISVLKNSIHSFLLTYYFEQYSDIHKNLDLKIAKYLNNKNQNKKQEKKIKHEMEIDIASDLVYLFLQGNFKNKEDFCKELSISKDYFVKCVNLIRINNNDLYIEYINKVNTNFKKKYATLIFLINKMVKYIKNGIEVNGIIREFDLLDYFQLINVSQEKLLEIAKRVLGIHDYYLIIKFLKKYNFNKSLKTNDINYILNEKVIIDVEFDKNNKPIIGTGRLIKTEEKQAVINYLKENNIPLYYDCYNIALKRYIHGNLVYNEVTKEKLIKNYFPGNKNR